MGLGFPTGPVSKPKSTKIAFAPSGGPVITNSARPAGGMLTVVTYGSPVTGTESTEINSILWGAPLYATCRARNPCVEAFSTRQNCCSPGSAIINGSECRGGVTTVSKLSVVS